MKQLTEHPHTPLTPYGIFDVGGVSGCLAQRGNPNAQAEFAQRMSIIWQKYDCHPLKAMLSPLVQLPIFIGFFSALRSLSAAKV
jgi:membrane protein insertase Oxa1/YidC/SpoIIIJ